MKGRYQIISRIPQRGMSAKQWALVIENELVKLWLVELSPAERESLAKGYAGASRAAFRKLYRIILEQAETLGWRIGLCTLVHRCFSRWDDELQGPELHRKYGLACAKSARIMQRRELPPIADPDQWQVKQETVEELRVALRNLRTTFALQRNRPQARQVQEAFVSTVVESPESFPHLAANLDRWQKFLEENPETLLPMTRGERAQPGNLYDEFLSWSTGWKVDSVRQAISRLKS